MTRTLPWSTVNNEQEQIRMIDLMAALLSNMNVIRS